MTDRELAFLRVLSEAPSSLSPGRIAVLAGYPHTKYLSAVASPTLDALERRGLVRGSYNAFSTGRTWYITHAGREALASDRNPQAATGSADTADTAPRP